MSQNPSLQQNAQFYPPQQQYIYQQTEQRYAQLPMHPNQAAIYMQPMAAPAIGPPHQQMHSFHQDYQQHQSTHPGPNYAPHPHPPQQLLTNMAAHGGPQIASLVPFNMMGMDGPPPMVSAPAHQQQPQHFHSHQQQPHLPPQSAPPPYHNQSSNFVPASKPKVNPSIPFYGGNHVDMKGNGPHQQMHPFHQDYQQHQSTYSGSNFMPHAHPPPSLLAPHGGQQITGIVSQFGMMSMNMDTPPPMVSAPAHQQHIYAHQQQHHMPPQSAPPSHTPFIPTSKTKGRSCSIQPSADSLQPAENTGAEESGGNNVDGKEGNEVLENGRNDGGGQQTPVDGRNSSTTDAQQTKTTPSSMETKEENKHRTLSGEGDKNKPIKMDQWQPSKDQPAASISPNNTVGGGHGHGTPPDSGSAMVTMTTNSAAINVPGRPPSSHQYQQQPNSQLQSRRTSQDNRQEGRGQEGGRIYNNSAYITSGRGDHGKYHQNRPSGHGHYNFNYKPNTGGGGGPPNMFSGNNPSNPSSHHQPQQYHHNYHQNNQSSFYGTRSDVRTNQCPACNNSGHRLMQCPETKVEREELHKFARQFEKQAHHPALQEPKEMTSSNRAPYHQRHSQEGGRGGGGGDYHHHQYNPQQQNNQHKRFGSGGGGGGGGGGNRYSNNNAFGGGRDGGGGIRASKGGGGGNYRPNAQHQQQQ